METLKADESYFLYSSRALGKKRLEGSLHRNIYSTYLTQHKIFPNSHVSVDDQTRVTERTHKSYTICKLPSILRGACTI